MKVGDYVRTKCGISKCIKVIPIRENSFMYEFDKEVYEDVVYLTASELEKYKSSPNIIDLIELNDIVELFEEDGLDNGEITGYYEVIAITTNKKEIGVRTANGEIDFFPTENLRGIITYEQIKIMEYKCE